MYRKLVENPTKAGRVITILIISAIFIQAINFFYYFMNSSGSQSTTINTVITYLCGAVVLCSLAFAIVLGIANKSYRNKLKSNEAQNTQVLSDDLKPETPVVTSRENE